MKKMQLQTPSKLALCLWIGDSLWDNGVKLVMDTAIKKMQLQAPSILALWLWIGDSFWDNGLELVME
jgi:hypothetical protein